MSGFSSEIIGLAAALSGAVVEKIKDRETLEFLSALLEVVSDNIALVLTCNDGCCNEKNIATNSYGQKE